MQEFIAHGLLTPVSTLRRGGDGGPWIFQADELNDLRKFVLSEVIAKIIDQSGGNGDEMQLGSARALAAHVAEHGKASATEKEFTARVGLGGAGLLKHFGSRDDEDDNGVLKTAGTVAAVAGAGLATTYGLGHYQAFLMSKKIAERHGQAVADRFLANVGPAQKIRAGFGAMKGGAARGVGAVIGGDTGAAAVSYGKTASAAALMKLRRAGGPAQAYQASRGTLGKVAGTVAPAAEGAAGSAVGAFAKKAITAGEGAIAGGLGAAARAPSLAALALRNLRRAAVVGTKL